VNRRKSRRRRVHLSTFPWAQVAIDLQTASSENRGSSHDSTSNFERYNDQSHLDTLLLYLAILMTCSLSSPMPVLGSYYFPSTFISAFDTYAWPPCASKASRFYTETLGVHSLFVLRQISLK